MRQRHVRPELRELRVDERRDLERRDGAGHRIGETWTGRPGAEPGRHALAKQDRQSEAQLVVGTTRPQRQPS